MLLAPSPSLIVPKRQFILPPSRAPLLDPSKENARWRLPLHMTIGTPTLILAASTYNIASGSPVPDETSVDAPAGSLVFIVVNHDAQMNSAIASVVDSNGNNYNLIQAAPNGGCTPTALAWIILPADLPIGSTFTVTTADGNNYDYGSVYMVSGVGGLDKSAAVNLTTAAESLSLSSGTLAHANAIAIGSSNFNTGAGVTATEATGFTNTYGAGAGSYGMLGYKPVSSAASVVYAPSWSASVTASAVLGVFYAAAIVAPRLKQYLRR